MEQLIDIVPQYPPGQEPQVIEPRHPGTPCKAGSVSNNRPLRAGCVAFTAPSA
jgi:hypothetical protein